MRSRSPNGVLTASYATEPTTVMLTPRRISSARVAEAGGLGSAAALSVRSHVKSLSSRPK